jgi:hypothetical protein
MVGSIGGMNHDPVEEEMKPRFTFDANAVRMDFPRWHLGLYRFRPTTSVLSSEHLANPKAAVTEKGVPSIQWSPVSRQF